MKKSFLTTYSMDDCCCLKLVAAGMKKTAPDESTDETDYKTHQRFYLRQICSSELNYFKYNLKTLFCFWWTDTNSTYKTKHNLCVG